jgi:CBS domain containing-hemolysin-like protein
VIPLVLAVSFFTAFLFAGSELGFTTLNRVLVEVWVKRGKPGARITRWFLSTPEKFLSLTLVGTNAAITTFTTLAVIYFSDRGISETLVFLSTTLLILVLAEIFPKVLFTRYGTFIFPWISWLLLLFYILLFPLIVVAHYLSAWLARGVGGGNDSEEDLYRKALISIFHDARAEELLDDQAQQIIQNVVELKERSVREILTPRTEIRALPVDATLEEAVQLMHETGFSKFPIYEKDLDHIVGYLAIKDLFNRPATIREVLRELEFYPETMEVRKLMQEFSRRQLSLAVILDEYGGTAGLVTREDLAEELFGEIQDEHDREKVFIRPLKSGHWLVNARVAVDDFFQLLGRPVPDGDWETLAGFVLEKVGEIPAQGSDLEIEGLDFHVVRANKRQLQVLILRNPPGEV